MKKYRIGIVGATGAVGQEIIKLMEKRDFPASEVRLLASAKSAGREVEALGNVEKIEETTPDSFKELKNYPVKFQEISKINYSSIHLTIIFVNSKIRNNLIKFF